MVKPLRGIRYWRSDKDPELPDPRDFVDPTWDEHDRDVVASDLRWGLVAHAFMGYSPCRLCDKRDNGDLDLTGRHLRLAVRTSELPHRARCSTP